MHLKGYLRRYKNPVQLTSFFAVFTSQKIKRPDHRPSLLWSWSSLVTVFFWSWEQTIHDWYLTTVSQIYYICTTNVDLNWMQTLCLTYFWLTSDHSSQKHLKKTTFSHTACNSWLCSDQLATLLFTECHYYWQVWKGVMIQMLTNGK